MRLELFDVLDEACDVLTKRRDDFIEAEVRIMQCLKSVLTATEDSIIELSSRIKSPISLREKMIRNKLYLDMNSGEEVIDSLHDVVGVTIKCQFIKEEKHLYERIHSVFHIQAEHGLYYNDKFPNIFFDLDMPQPQLQKNGYEVYRIDGHCQIGGKKVNFELQIKAIVFTFWSEIEHKIVYKNNNYSLNNEFIRQLLNSLRMSLHSIDSQLNIIYNEMQQIQMKNRTLDEHTMKQVIAKSINDIFIDKIQESIGFTINFKNECDLLSHYLYHCQQVSKQEDQSVYVNIANRLEEIKFEKLDFESPILFDDEIYSEDRFTQIISSAFLWYMHSDFEWYVFFRMLFVLMPESNDTNFKLFVSLYRDRFAKDSIYRSLQIHFEEPEIQEIINELLATIAISLVEIGNSSILHEEKLDGLVPYITKFCDVFAYEITDYAAWTKYQVNLMHELKDLIISYFRHKEGYLA